MQNLAPDITRQRLLLEGFYSKTVDEKFIKDYFVFITQKLGLRIYGEPVIFCPGGEGKEENQGYDAFVPLIDSGISLYVWSSAKFFSIIIYTCKSFDARLATDATKEFFGAMETEAMEF